MKALSTIMPKLAKNAMGKIGVDFGNLIIAWPNVMGTDFASKCSIEKIDFKKDERGNATVTLAVQTYFATECQYQIPYLIDKINSYMGYQAVGSIKLKQIMTNPKSLKNNPLKQNVIKTNPLSEADKSTINSSINTFENQELKEILQSYGEAIYKKR
ncbi:MAG: DUF721 domain-containing protein [Alphaproteobacteria bacterium]|jgi:hypothetical protein|nr:DUF721 domain-containing protein [Alphaproteobacteria bacterium]